MAYTLSLSTVADSISKLSISGVTVKDVDQLAPAMTSNVLYPLPNGWITGAKFTPVTYGSNSGEQANFTCNMTYRFLGTLVGDMGAFNKAYSNVISKMTLILNAILSNDVITGAVDFRFVGVANIGPVSDPAGNMYHGCDLTFMYEEFL